MLVSNITITTRTDRTSQLITEFVTNMIHDPWWHETDKWNKKFVDQSVSLGAEQIYFQNYFQRELLVACVFYLLLNVLFCYEYSPRPQWIQNRQIYLVLVRGFNLENIYIIIFLHTLIYDKYDKFSSAKERERDPVQTFVNTNIMKAFLGGVPLTTNVFYDTVAPLEPSGHSCPPQLQLGRHKDR